MAKERGRTRSCRPASLLVPAGPTAQVPPGELSCTGSWCCRGAGPSGRQRYLWGSCHEVRVQPPQPADPTSKHALLVATFHPSIQPLNQAPSPHLLHRVCASAHSSLSSFPPSHHLKSPLKYTGATVKGLPPPLHVTTTEHALSHRPSVQHRSPCAAAHCRIPSLMQAHLSLMHAPCRCSPPHPNALQPTDAYHLQLLTPASPRTLPLIDACHLPLLAPAYLRPATHLCMPPAGRSWMACP